jgi:acyl-CoA hydrolase
MHCYITTLIFLEYEIVALGRRSMNVDVAVMCQNRSHLGYATYSL